MHDFFKMMRQYASPYKGYLAGAVVLNMLSAIFNIFSFAVIVPLLNILFKVDSAEYAFIPWGTEGMKFKDILVNNAYWFVSDFSAAHGAVTALLLLCLVMIFFTALKTSCYFGSAAVMIPIRTGIVKDIRNRIYNKILALPIGFFSQERKGDIIARMSGDVNEVENSITASIEMLIKDPILILFYFGILIFLSPEMMLVMLTFVPAFIWIMGVIGKQLKRQSLEAQTLWSDTMSQVEETLGGLRIVKAFNAERKVRNRFEGENEKYRNIVTRLSRRYELAHPMSEFLGTLTIAIVLWFGGTLILGGHSSITAPKFIYYMVIFYSIINPAKDLSKASYAIQRGLASMQRIDKILTADNPIKSPEHPTPLTQMKDGIQYKDVRFRYGDAWVIDGVSLDIKRGQTVAFVGQSGSGKTTMADLLPRFYDVQEGSISIDGTDIRQFDITDLRSLMGNVNQEAILFNDSFYNNITFGVENATREQVEEAARIANAYDFIMASEQGFDTNIGDRGCKLSGGQRQRISIARAILKNPPILILDEATSALDTESEHLVQDALDKLMHGRTTLVIAHRLSTIKGADLICVMQDGRIIERGTHDELIARQGAYKHLVDMQTF